MIPYLKAPHDSPTFKGYAEAIVAFSGEPTKISFDLDAACVTDLEKPLSYLITNEEMVLGAIATAVESELLPLYNNHWRCYMTGTGHEVERPALTLDEFLKTVTLQEIEVSNLLVQFWYDDGELFHGHGILVSASYVQTPGGIALRPFSAGLDG